MTTLITQCEVEAKGSYQTWGAAFGSACLERVACESPVTQSCHAWRALNCQQGSAQNLMHTASRTDENMPLNISDPADLLRRSNAKDEKASLKQLDSLDASLSSKCI